MKQAKELLEQVNEASFTIQRHKAIRNGKVVLLRTRKYAGPAQKDGYKRDEATGRLVRMTPLERRRRSRAQKRAQNKAGAKRHREISMRRRGNLLDSNEK